jgi:type VI secretion system protein ImpH
VANRSAFERLFSEPHSFDFFQAVRLLGRSPEALMRAEADGHWTDPARYKAHLSLAFPASAVHAFRHGPAPGKPPALTVTFLGLFGPSGVLPRHYTEQLLAREAFRPAGWEALTEAERERHGGERTVTRDWLDMFNHRFVSLFYQAWEKYRFPLAYERGGPEGAGGGPFTQALRCLVGLGTPGLRDRLRVDVVPPAAAGEPPPAAAEVGRVRDLGLLRFAGLLAQSRRNAWGLRALLGGYFGLAVEVEQFRGQWLRLEPECRTRLGAANATLGDDALAGDRVWNVEGKFRLRVGPLAYREFLEYLPDSAPASPRKSFFLLCQLARLYAGPELDFDVQLLLRAADVPACRLSPDPAAGPRLGWNCWLLTRPAAATATEAVFEADESTRFGPSPAA